MIGKIFELFFIHVAAMAISVFLALPIVWSLASSFKPDLEIFAALSPPTIQALLPVPFSWNAYFEVFGNSIFMKALVNTVWVASWTVFLGVLINAMAGYAFAVMKFRFQTPLFLLVVLTFLVPPDLLVLPTYDLVSRLGWTDTKTALILPMVANGIVIFMFAKFFKSVPISMSEAGMIDGAGHFTLFFRIYLPLCLPTVIGAALLLFISQWEAFLWPLIVSGSPDNQMLQVALSTFKEEHGIKWNLMFAATGLIAFIPLLIMLPLQRYYVSGLMGTGIK